MSYLWLLEYNDIADDFISEICTEEEAERRLKALGLTPEEIKDHLWSLKHDA